MKHTNGTTTLMWISPVGVSVLIRMLCHFPNLLQERRVPKLWHELRTFEQ